MAAFLAGYSSAEALWHGPQVGAFFEAFVVSQALRWRDWHMPTANLWFWREAGGREVDLLIERDGRLHPIEIKVTEHPNRRDFPAYRTLQQRYGRDSVAPGVIACTTSHPHAVDAEIEARPGWLFAALT